MYCNLFTRWFSTPPFPFIKDWRNKEVKGIRQPSQHFITYFINPFNEAISLLKVNDTGFHDIYHHNKIGDCSKAFTNTQSLVTRFDLPMITCHKYSVSQISEMQLMFNCFKLYSISFAFKPDGIRTQFNGETQFILCNLVTGKNL